MNFLYITLLTLRVLKWPQSFWNICGPCGGIGMYSLTHAHAQLYVLATLIPCVATLVCPGRLLAATLKTRHTLTHFSSCQFSRYCCLCLLKPQCMDDKLSQPRGWSSTRCPPQPHPLCVHLIPPFRRTCETTCSAFFVVCVISCAQNIQNNSCK
jgi:hypothetical protein